MKRRIIIILICFCLALSAGCTNDGGKEQFETARLEELQNNHEHARQLYREILEKYPDSTYAESAKKRLSELEKKP